MEVTEAGTGMQNDKLLLGVDTCGPVGSVALARLAGGVVEIVGQVELEGRSYSAQLVAAIGEVLATSGTKLSLLHAMVVVNGPGSFTGVRVGLSAVKGLAEPGQTPVVAVSRLEVLAWKAGCAAAALDAHRQEVFLRVGERELLAGAEGLAGFDFAAPRAQSDLASNAARLNSLQESFIGIGSKCQGTTSVVPQGPQNEGRALAPGADFPALESKTEPFQQAVKPCPVPNQSGVPETFNILTGSVAVCDEAAAGLVATAWPGVQLVKVQAPRAADALRLCAGRVEAGDFADLALLDGHYLRRSDAEIFGNATKAKSGAVQGA